MLLLKGGLVLMHGISQGWLQQVKATGESEAGCRTGKGLGCILHGTGNLCYICTLTCPPTFLHFNLPSCKHTCSTTGPLQYTNVHSLSSVHICALPFQTPDWILRSRFDFLLKGLFCQTTFAYETEYVQYCDLI